MRLTKDELIEKYRDCNTNCDWWEPIFEGFREDLSKEGIDVGEISWEGVYHQGSYADFSCRVNDVGLFMRANKIEGDYPTIYKLAELDGVSISKSDGQMRRHTYLDVEVGDWEYHLPDMDEDMAEYYIALYQADTDREYPQFEQSVEDILDEHAKDLYRTLMQEYEYLCSDEAVWETIQCNEWDKEVA